MNKIYLIFGLVMVALAIFWTEKSFSQTIIGPDGSVVSKDMIICV